MLKRAALCMLLTAMGCAAVRPIPAVYDDPTVAYPFSEATVRRGDVSACMAQLLERSGYGNLPAESAAFLVLDAERFDCAIWPGTNQHHAASWRGAPPAGTAAILHTHPASLPSPSPGDIFQASAAGIPVFVITPLAVSMVAPSDGRITTFGPPMDLTQTAAVKRASSK